MIILTTSTTSAAAPIHSRASCIIVPVIPLTWVTRSLSSKLRPRPSEVHSRTREVVCTLLEAAWLRSSHPILIIEIIHHLSSYVTAAHLSQTAAPTTTTASSKTLLICLSLNIAIIGLVVPKIGEVYSRSHSEVFVLFFYYRWWTAGIKASRSCASRVTCEVVVLVASLMVWWLAAVPLLLIIEVQCWSVVRMLQ